MSHSFDTLSSSLNLHFYLHSIPTRRSSDLLDEIHQPVELLVPVELDAALLLGLDGPDDAIDDFGQVVRDRKSTRLNSSHLVISYAVFCLKKKIIGLLLNYDYIK